MFFCVGINLAASEIFFSFCFLILESNHVSLLDRRGNIWTHTIVRRNMWSSQKAEEDLEKLVAHAEEKHLYVDVVARTDADGCTVHEQFFFQQDKFSIVSNSRSGIARESNTQGWWGLRGAGPQQFSIRRDSCRFQRGWDPMKGSQRMWPSQEPTEQNWT